MCWPKYLSRIFTGTIALFCAACMNQSKENAKEKEIMVPSQPSLPPLKAGQVLDKNSEYAKRWPGQPILLKLETKEPLILAIPPQFAQFWLVRDEKIVRAPAPLSKIPIASSINFDMFMPDFSGFTPENYLQEYPLHKDLVQIITIEPADPAQAAPGAPGYHIPNNLLRLFPSGLDSVKYEDKYGLRCYAKAHPSDASQFCVGQRDDARQELILLDVTAPPFAEGIVFPIMQARYYTSRYGGMRIVWRSHVKHLPRWKEIDQQIWTYIDKWNIAKSLAPAIPSNTQPRK